MMSEKKATLDKLAQAEEEVEQTAKALQNLQEALEQFQRGDETYTYIMYPYYVPNSVYGLSSER